MPTTVVVTRNAPERYRGFLASCMLEVAPGVYVSPNLSAGVRTRIWEVCCDWATVLPRDGGISMVHVDRGSPAGLAILNIGAPKAEFLDHEGVWLARHDLHALPNEPDAPPQ